MARKKQAVPTGYDPQTGLIPRAVVLVQPAASLVVAGRMPILRMAWGTDHRGRVYVVAGMLWDEINRAACNSRPYVSALKALGYNRDNPLPMGSIVGHVDLFAVENYIEVEDDEFIPGLSVRTYHGRSFRNRYDWILDNPYTCESTERVDTYPCLFRIDGAEIGPALATARPAGPGPAVVPTPMDGTILEVGWRAWKARAGA